MSRRVIYRFKAKSLRCQHPIPLRCQCRERCRYSMAHEISWQSDSWLTLVWFPSRNILASERPLPLVMGGAEKASRTASSVRPALSLSIAAVVPSSANSFTPSDAGCILCHNRLHENLKNNKRKAVYSAHFCESSKRQLAPSLGRWNIMILIFFIIFGARSLTRVILAFGEHNHESGNWLQKWWKRSKSSCAPWGVEL